MDIIRPMQLGFNQRVLEQNRQFYFTASATLGINLQTGEEQIDALFLKDAFQGNPDNPPLLDLGFPKPNGEFLLSGSYHCPSQSPVKGGEVTARIGNIEKKLYVFGPRKWQHGFPSEPEEITSMPLILQNAFGGEGYENNPVGRGFQDGLLPCIEYPKTLVASQKDKPLPACFSALDLMDPRRKKYKGTYNLDYKEKYFPGHPADMDWKMFLSTTDDQWHKGFFMGDEEYLLKNLHPEISRIEGKLPGLYARCFVNQKKQGEDTFGEIPLNLDTIWFFPEKMLALLIFRGVIKVDDDEAESITHVLGAYEYLSQSRRSLEYYHAALEKRIQNDDAFLKLLTTSDLIPEDHKCAMEVLFDMGVSETPEKSALVQNAEAKAAAMKKTADEEVEQAKKQAEKSMDDIDIPDQAMEFIPDDAKADLPGKKGGLDIGKLMDKKPDASPDPDIDILNQKMEEIFPGITSGDPKKMDMKNFSFDKFRGIADVAKEFSDKKKNDVMEDIKEKIESTKNDLKNQVDDIDKQINQIKKTGDKEGKSFDDEIKPLEEAKKQLQENMELIEIPDLDKPPEKMPLPRIDSEEIMSLLTQTPAFPPEIMEAMQHVQARKDMGIDDEKNRALEKEILAAEKKITDAMETTRKETEKQLSQIKNKFKSAYIMGAHHMEEGLSPHKESVDERKKHFLEAVSKNQDVSGQDWACIDLSGENLDGIDLSNAFLEQVNFKKASLKGANLSRSIMARTNLEEANLEGANLEGANIGGVHGLRTDFSQANMKSAKLSKS
ncbi:MAG: DUF2169 domain-containing protein, partial [Thermodesulfobacteriota bacterium]|nr:DUF2169 domain-containing protein [Thermodesulfobacteriota bacterium]